MDMEFISGVMEEVIKESEKIIKWMDKASFNGLMEVKC
jgi:hypothetical protein